MLCEHFKWPPWLHISKIRFCHALNYSGSNDIRVLRACKSGWSDLDFYNHMTKCYVWWRYKQFTVTTTHDIWTRAREKLILKKRLRVVSLCVSHNIISLTSSLAILSIKIILDHLQSWQKCMPLSSLSFWPSLHTKHPTPVALNPLASKDLFSRNI